MSVELSDIQVPPQNSVELTPSVGEYVFRVPIVCRATGIQEHIAGREEEEARLNRAYEDQTLDADRSYWGRQRFLSEHRPTIPFLESERDVTAAATLAFGRAALPAMFGGEIDTEGAYILYDDGFVYFPPIVFTEGQNSVESVIVEGFVALGYGSDPGSIATVADTLLTGRDILGTARRSDGIHDSAYAILPPGAAYLGVAHPTTTRMNEALALAAEFRAYWAEHSGALDDVVARLPGVLKEHARLARLAQEQRLTSGDGIAQAVLEDRFTELVLHKERQEDAKFIRGTVQELAASCPKDVYTFHTLDTHRKQFALDNGVFGEKS